MLVKLIQIVRDANGHSRLSEIFINSSHIISVSEDPATGQNILGETRNLGLTDTVQFSKVIISEGNRTRALTIIGTPTEIQGKIRKKQILRG
jgi:hypothetical protein